MVCVAGECPPHAASEESFQVVVVSVFVSCVVVVVPFADEHPSSGSRHPLSVARHPMNHCPCLSLDCPHLLPPSGDRHLGFVRRHLLFVDRHLPFVHVDRRSPSVDCRLPSVDSRPMIESFQRRRIVFVRLRPSPASNIVATSDDPNLS